MKDQLARARSVGWVGRRYPKSKRDEEDASKEEWMRDDGWAM
jgi:hypothetical protein